MYVRPEKIFWSQYCKFTWTYQDLDDEPTDGHRQQADERNFIFGWLPRAFADLVEMSEHLLDHPTEQDIRLQPIDYAFVIYVNRGRLRAKIGAQTFAESLHRLLLHQKTFADPRRVLTSSAAAQLLHFHIRRHNTFTKLKIYTENV